MPDQNYKYRQGDKLKDIKGLNPSEIKWFRCHYDYIINNNETIKKLNKEKNMLLIKI